MSAWTYYSPLWLGVLLALVMNDTIQGQAQADSAAVGWLIVIGVGIVVGLTGQLLMIGAQGASAQVLPVPVGRSIRGRGAVVGGFLIIAFVTLAGSAFILRSEEFRSASLISGFAALAALLSAAVIYIWSWPVAVRDFDARSG